MNTSVSLLFTIGIAFYFEMRDAGWMITQLGTPRGRYDEHSNKFSLSKKPRFVDPVGKSQT
jgi:hypothetical protein